MSDNLPESKPYRIKVYVVMESYNLKHKGEANREVIAVKLTKDAAQSIVDQKAGRFIEKYYADKLAQS